MGGYRAVALIVSTAIFMQFLDATALNTALPVMGRDLHVPVVSLNIAILAYQLPLAAFIPVGTIAAERLGARTTFAAALAVFLIGSLLCAMSTTLTALAASRAFQGLGGAVMTPVSRQIVVRSAEKHELVSAMNWLLIPGIVGPLIGPVVGGLFVTYLSWHWIFLINVPIALAGIVLTLTVVPDDGLRASGSIDVKGVLLIAATIICLMFGLEGLARPQGGWEVAALLAGGVLLGGLYVRHAAGNPAAALDLSLFRIDAFRHSAIAGTLLRTIVGATGFLLPLWFQLAMGMDAVQSGMLIVASTFGALLSRFLGRPLMRIAHPRQIAVGGTACVIVALASTACLHPGLPRLLFMAALFAQGMAISIPLMMVSAVAYADIPPDRLAAATGLYTTVQQITLSLGVTAGVWTIGAMRWIARSGPADSITYAGSLLMLAGFAAVAVYATGRIGRNALGALRAPSG